MKIAVIDDEKIFRDELKNLILMYGNTFEIELFESAEEFLLTDSNKYAIAFVDIELGGMNGIELANKIKDSDINTLIFYTTSYTSYITPALRTTPFQYLVKPIDKKTFMEEFDRAINYLARRDALFDVKTLDGMRQVKIGEILYIECLNRKIELHTFEQTIYSYGTIKEILSKVVDYNFVKCHAAFIINLAAIKSIKGYNAILKNGAVIPISKKELATTREMYAKYIARERI